MRDWLALALALGPLGTVATIGSTSWGRIVERLCYLYPPLIGVGVIGLLQDADPGIPLLERGLVLVGTAGYTILTLLLAIALFADARDVRRVGGWNPNPWLYAGSALALAPIVSVYYLFRRHRQFGTPAGRSEWWLVVAASFCATVLGLAAAAIGFVLAFPTLVATAIGVAGALAFGAFPVAIHRDAAYVCLQRTSWQPNPGLYLGLAFLCLSIPVVQPVLAAYYLYKRRRAVGLSIRSPRARSVS